MHRDANYDEMVRLPGDVWECPHDGTANVTGYCCAARRRTRSAAQPIEWRRGTWLIDGGMQSPRAVSLRRSTSSVPPGDLAAHISWMPSRFPGLAGGCGRPTGHADPAWPATWIRVALEPRGGRQGTQSAAV